MRFDKRIVALAVLTIMVLAPLAGIAPTALADGTVPPDVDAGMRQRVQDSVIKGLDWFAETQNVDGSWSTSVGVTGFVVICFTGAGYDYTNGTVQRALGHLRNFYNNDTGILADTFPNYETAISLIAMASAGDPEDADRLPKMAGYLEHLQFSEDSEYHKTDPWYHGGWPNYAGIPDVSNSQFGVLGLMALELMSPDYVVPGNVHANVTTFQMKCQNWPDVNDMPWAHNITLPSHGDGGFVYNAYRSRTPLGEQMFESYGSITGAGYFSYMASGHDERNPEVTAAREWLDHEYSLELNPRMVGKGLYYYLWSQTRALALSGQDWVVDGSGKLHHWRSDVAELFMDLQLPNGKWPGNPEIGWREEEPEIAGIYAILSMQAAYMTAPNPELTISVHTQKEVTFIDVEGRVLETDPAKGLEVKKNMMVCSDPEIFRKVWLKVPSDPEGRTLIVRGTWGEGRTAELTRTVGSAPATVLVATGGFAGPFGFHATVFDDAPAFDVDKTELELVRGETEIIDFEVTETTGKGPVNRLILITHGGEGVVADVDGQGMHVPAGDVDVLRLTISVDQDVKAGQDRYLVITSSTAPPLVVPVKVVDSEDSELATGVFYWMLIILLAVLVFFFLLLPRISRGDEEGTEGPEADDEETGPAVEEQVPEPEVEAGEGKGG